MRRERSPSWQRGLLLFLLGALVGANAVYWTMTRGIGPLRRTPQPVEIPLPAETSTRVPNAADTRPPNAVLPLPVVRATGSGPEVPAPAGNGLLLPVQGVTAAQLQDTFSDARSGGRVHDAIDILAPAGTPVLAVADGTVEKLFDSKLGGITLYQFNPARTHAYYYAHLQGYAAGIAEQQALKRGQVIGYVGATGNASADAPHLHFAIFELGPERRWWEGTAINPYPLLGGK